MQLRFLCLAFLGLAACAGDNSNKPKDIPDSLKVKILSAQRDYLTISQAYERVRANLQVAQEEAQKACTAIKGKLDLNTVTCTAEESKTKSLGQKIFESTSRK